MPRQPFLPTYAGTPIAMAAWMVDEMPELAQAIGRITVNWSGVDLQMALLLGSLIGVENEAAVAVFLSLRNHRAQRDAMDAAAEKRLAAELRKGFNAIMAIHRRLDKQRNDVVHGMWGRGNETPDGLVWCSLQDHANMIVRDYHAVRPDYVSPDYDRTYELTRTCYVVRFSDLDQLNTEIRLLAEAIGNFHAHLRYGSSIPGENALKSFEANTMVQQELQRVTQARGGDEG